MRTTSPISAVHSHAAGSLAHVAPIGAEASLLELTHAGCLPDVLSCLRRQRPAAALVLAADANAREASVRLVGRASDDAVRLDRTAAGRGDCELRFSLYDVPFVLHGWLHQNVVHGPLRLFTLDRRGVYRQPLSPGRGEARWRVPDSEHPRQVRSEIRDLTPRGVCIATRRDPAPAPPDTPFPVELQVAGSEPVMCLARRRRSPLQAEQGYGLELLTERVPRPLVEAYLRERVPALQPRADASSAELHALMRESGYLALRAVDAGFDRWRDFAPESGDSFDRVYRAADGRLLGHASATRIYDRGWLLHQLACLTGHAESGACRNELYTMVATVPTLVDGERASALAYFNQKNRWHRLFFVGFLDWLSSSALGAICGFDRFERDDPAPRFDVPEGAVTGLPDRADRLEATALVRAQLPTVTADAFDIHPAALHRPPETRHGRGRHMLTLREGGELRAVALCEMGDPAGSLFNVINMAQLYLRTGSAAPSVPAQRALVSAARRLYADHGVRRPLLVAPEGTLHPEVEPGTRLEETMGCAVFTGAGLRQWQRYCRFQMGRRWRRHGRDGDER